MKLAEFRELTKNHPDDAEIVIAGGGAMMRGIDSGSLAPSSFHPNMAKVWSIADTKAAIVLEL